MPTTALLDLHIVKPERTAGSMSVFLDIGARTRTGEERSDGLEAAEGSTPKGVPVLPFLRSLELG